MENKEQRRKSKLNFQSKIFMYKLINKGKIELAKLFKIKV